MSEQETVACVVCRKPSKGYIAAGHVRTEDGREILATFCSERCEGKAPTGKPRRPGYLGPWKDWMGAKSYGARVTEMTRDAMLELLDHAAKDAAAMRRGTRGLRLREHAVFTAALRAEVEAHRPCKEAGCTYQGKHCGDCGSGAWPCPTILRLGRALR